MRAKFLSLLFLLMPMPAMAEVSQADCKSVDMTSKFGPVRDQGAAGFCYSFAAADVLSEALEVKPPQAISAMYLAAQYISLGADEVTQAANQIVHPRVPPEEMIKSPYGIGSIDPYEVVYDPANKPLLKREGGYADFIMSRALSLPTYCTESDVPSEIIGKSYRNTEEQYFFLKRMGQLADSPDIEAFATARQNNLPLPECLKNSPLAKLVGTIQEVKPALNNYAAAQLRATTAAACTHQMKSPAGLAVHSLLISKAGLGYGAFAASASSKPNDEGALAIAGILRTNRPLEINYNACVLTKCAPADLHNHASVVVAEKWNPKHNRCEVKIRNSWGKSCGNKRPDVTCHKGQWWVGLDELAKNTTRASWIEKN